MTPAILFAFLSVAFLGCNDDDLTNPVITLLGDNVLDIKINDQIAFADPGYSASDNEDGDITSRVIISGDPVDVSKIGTYEIIYSVSDNAGNNTTVNRTVNIVVTLDFVDRSLYTGSWNAEELVTNVGTGVTNSYFFTATVHASGKDSVILAENFGGFGASFIAELKIVDKFGKLVIPSQLLNASGQCGIIEGNAATSENLENRTILNLKYDINYADGTIESVEGVWTKKIME